MIIPASSPSNNLLYTTVRIETFSGGRIGSGTAFFYNLVDEAKGTMPLIVTNKHVVKDAEIGMFQVHLADSSGSAPSGQFETFSIPSFKSQWVLHPDPNVDLAAMPIQPLRLRVSSSGKSMFYRALDKRLIRTPEQLLELNALEDAVMVGYPIGLWDKTNNLPILRRGTTATHPAADFNGEKVGLIDIACFPGSSGSPVFIFNSGPYTDSKGNTLVSGGRVVLLGVLFAGPQIDVHGSIHVVDIPTASTQVATSKVMVHLGYYIKAAEVESLAEHMDRMYKSIPSKP